MKAEHYGMKIESQGDSWFTITEGNTQHWLYWDDLFQLGEVLQTMAKMAKQTQMGQIKP